MKSIFPSTHLVAIFFISAFPLLGKALLRFLFNVSISEICQTLTMNHECIVEILYNIIVGVISIAPTIIIAIRIIIIAIIVFTIFLNIFFNSDSRIQKECILNYSSSPNNLKINAKPSSVKKLFVLHHSPLKGRQRISRKQLPPDLDFAFERSFFASSSSDLANLPNLCFLLYHSFYLLYRDLQVQFYKTWFFKKLVIMLPVFAGLLVNQLIVSLFVRRTSPCYCV